MNNNTEINVKCEFSFTEEEYDTLVSATETYGITINELFQALAKDITALDRHAMDWYGKSKALLQASRPFVSYIFREHAADIFVDFPLCIRWRGKCAILERPQRAVRGF